MAKTFPLATDPWFENILMSLCCAPTPQANEEFARGLELFRAGRAFNVPNFRKQQRFSETMIGTWITKNMTYLSGRPLPSEYIDAISGRYVGADPGFLRHNYYFLRSLKKSVSRRRKSVGAITEYSEESYFKGVKRRVT